ncbi:hypothetical protein AU193_02380 [Mycobacterium sp. GA-1285]|uniref:2'-5' RNA ligase family protein n=1 Tax=Mycobacterium sp. GA-1285 TaxID=1772282 RepID=UPI0007471502|nr:2'-5' RNA ligase family protein [Mycobacterium sp. GA-1285]KUI11976.1 hypothetical protein AU193_02380 [Mycobacterium sp. GA-1285]
MVHSIELVFDPDTDAQVRRIWDDLMRAGIRSQASNKAPSNKPHVTVTVAENIDEAVNTALRPVLKRLPLPCTIGAPMLFGGRVFTLVRVVVPSDELLGLHRDVHERCLPHMPKGVLGHADPGQWTPHVTLARRVAPEKLPAALTLESVARDVRGVMTGIRHWDGDNRVEYPIT